MEIDKGDGQEKLPHPLILVGIAKSVLGLHEILRMDGISSAVRDNVETAVYAMKHEVLAPDGFLFAITPRGLGRTVSVGKYYPSSRLIGTYVPSGTVAVAEDGPPFLADRLAITRTQIVGVYLDGSAIEVIPGKDNLVYVPLSEAERPIQ